MKGWSDWRSVLINLGYLVFLNVFVLAYMSFKNKTVTTNVFQYMALGDWVLLVSLALFIPFFHLVLGVVFTKKRRPFHLPLI